MTDEGRAKHIISVAKSLKRFSASDIRIATFLHASSMAGRAGLVASALRSQNLSVEQAIMLAAAEGFSVLDFKDRLVPWLESSGLVHVTRAQGELVSLRSVILAYSNILDAVSTLYDGLDPSLEDRACLLLLEHCSSLPVPESEAIHLLAKLVPEERANTALTIAKSYRIVDYREGKGLSEPLLYSSRIWSACIEKADKYLVHLDNTDRAVLVELVDRVRKYQGMPRRHLEKFATENNANHLLDVAVRLRLIHETRLEMSGGKSRSFLTTAHFYDEIASEHGEDVCDRVKIFLDSIRNGQHFANPGTGRILDPAVLLAKLLDRETIGPCTAIGSDYLTSEKAGIVRARQSSRAGRYFLDLVQRDTVEKVHEVITTGAVDSRPKMEASHVREGSQFHSIEQCSPVLADVPVGIEEAERAIMLRLREG